MRQFVLLALTLVLAGCGTADDKRAVRDVTTRFYAAVQADRGKDACDLLSAEARSQLEGQTKQDCDDVVARLADYGPPQIEGVALYVTSARVDMGGGESVYLAQEPDGWRLTALQCVSSTGKPRDRPQDCELEG